jgi:DNA polymerase-3 subunit delta'
LQANDLIVNEKVKDSLLWQGLERLPHALLLIGPPGVGKRDFAEQLVALLLCEAVTPDMKACGQCVACHWLASGNHPDFRRIAPDGDDKETEETKSAKSGEKAKKQGAGIIRIDQIRELEDFVFVGSHRQANRVVLITEAEAMQAAAANSLLKILEEPPSSVYFILVSSRQKMLLPTLRSRCRVVPFTQPDRQAATNWLIKAGLEKQAARYLDLAGGAPLRVVQWKNEGQLAAIDTLLDSLLTSRTDPLALAANWDALLKSNESFRLENLVEGIQRWLFDLTLARMGGEIHYHRGWPQPKRIETLDTAVLFAAWHEINAFRRSARHPLNQLLFLESLAFYYLRALQPHTP